MKFLVVFAGLVAYAAAANVGENCANNAACTVDKSYCKFTDPCTTGVCTCDTDYTTASSTSCVAIQYKKVGESCSGTYDSCKGDWTTCSSNVCACSTGFTGSSGDSDCSWPTQKDIGASCTNSAECKVYKYWYEQDNKGVAPHSTTVSGDCISSVCACSTNFVADGSSKCKSNLAAYGASCSTDSDCDTTTYPQTTCVSSVCGCRSGYYASGGGYTIYDYYSQSCVPDGYTAVKKGESCSASTALCASKGETCGTCPGSSAQICMDGAEHISISLILLVAAMLMHKLW